MDKTEISIYIMAIFYIIAGLNHFINPQFYLRMLPKYLPFHHAINLLSGFFEIILGICLFIVPIRNYGLIGIIVLLILVFPANIEMVTSKHFKHIPLKLKVLRLPIQGVLIYWAYFHLN